MRFKTLPIFTLATYRMGSNFSIRVTPNINLITVGLVCKVTKAIKLLKMENYDSQFLGGYQSLARKISPNLAQVPRPQLMKTFITNHTQTKIGI